MWGGIDNKKTQIARAVEFTGNHKLYGSFMVRVANEWRYSCENALTDYSLNRKAWIGHAACALALQIPESIIREAWGKLNYEQQLLANNEADRAIRSWEQSYRENHGLRDYVGEPLL